MEKVQVTYWLIIIIGDVAPSLRGPFKTEKMRNTYAKAYRSDDPEMKDGIYKLTIDKNVPIVNTYSGGFFE